MPVQRKLFFRRANKKQEALNHNVWSKKKTCLSGQEDSKTYAWNCHTCDHVWPHEKWVFFIETLFWLKMQNMIWLRFENIDIFYLQSSKFHHIKWFRKPWGIKSLHNFYSASVVLTVTVVLFLTQTITEPVCALTDSTLMF